MILPMSADEQRRCSSKVNSKIFINKNTNFYTYVPPCIGNLYRIYMVLNDQEVTE